MNDKMNGTILVRVTQGGTVAFVIVGAPLTDVIKSFELQLQVFKGLHGDLSKP